ncbi:IgGFc-binding protein-like [Lingula anatina]|uniref:IgGFc-binding protein-like n=1 Tax=Lingula anatina TaxID=7574 RepID=A0A1S3HWP3_LINAN|nr:IgGFc-binding protein-like [Lingula anatina]|eukprot:XP_013390462.1 IgGFc-binding protein-like [Lingula anatina]
MANFLQSRLPHFGVTRVLTVLFLTLALPVLVDGLCSQRPGQKQDQCCPGEDWECVYGTGSDSCFCDEVCYLYGTCCSDYQEYCLGDTSTQTGGQCIIRGDPHFKQFDGHQYHFSGLCTYILSDTLPGADEQFNITGTFIPNKPGSNRTMIQQVLIAVRGMAIQITTDGTVKVNNATIVATTTPQDVGNGVMLSLNPEDFPRTVVEVPDVVKVALTTPVGESRRRGHRAIITVPNAYAGQLNGLCGDFDGDSTDYANPCSGGPPAHCFVNGGSC